MATKTAGGNAAFHNFHNDFAHIQDPNERRRLALAEIDKAPFGWYHVRAIAVAGIGFFTDAYDIFAINLVTNMLGVVYWQNAKSQPGHIPSASDTAIKVATSGGTVIGQVGFGWLADVVGRKRMYGLELILIIFATLAQALSSASQAMSVVGLIIFWRVLMGIGIGGDYPLSSIITSEFATTKWRGAMMGAVFAMQGIGQFTAAIIALITATGFENSLKTAKGVQNCSGVCGLAVDKMWRIIIGFGAVPACIALYFRLTIPETPRYTFDVARDAEKAVEDVKAYKAGEAEGKPDEVSRAAVLQDSRVRLDPPKASWRDFWHHYGQWRHGKILLGTAGSWFFLDVAFYGLGLNNTIILTAIGYAGGSNVYHIFRNAAVGNLIIVCAGAIPGYWVTVATVDTIGRKPIQLMVSYCRCRLQFHANKYPGIRCAHHPLLHHWFRVSQTQPRGTVGTIRLVPILLQLWTKRNNIHRPWRVLPHPLPFHLPWSLRCLWKDWSHNCSDNFRSASNSWTSNDRQPLPMAQPCHVSHLQSFLVKIFLTPF